MPRSSIPWFVALPDVESSAAVAERLRHAGATAEVPHPSGRPWLIGTWPTRQLTVGRGRGATVAVLGEHDTTADLLDTDAARLHSVEGLDAVHARVRGSVHLMASVRGRVRVQGTASGLRRVFTARVGGITVAGDNANVLAQLSGARLDRAQIATRLLFPHAPWPLSWQSPWCGVVALPPQECLLLDERGAARQVRWWTPPEPELSEAEGAEAFGVALTAAVQARVRPGDAVVSHLSGLDSSSVCSLAVRAKGTVTAITAAQPDAMDDDVFWAGQTVAGLRDAGYELDHEIIPADQCPLVYDGILDASDEFDEPFLFLHNIRRYHDILDRGERRSPRLHLMGLGGDEMNGAILPWLPGLLRSRPALALRRLRAVAAKNRWSVPTTVATALRDRSYSTWLRSAGNRLGRVPPASGPGSVGWGAFPVVPGWLTSEAVELVRAALANAAAESADLSPHQGIHHNLAGIHGGAQIMRGFQQVAAQRGIVASAPFFDDHVMTAALSVRAEDRVDPGRYKPVLATAMLGVVPEATLKRSTKSETAAAAVLGSRRHRDQLVGLAQDPALVGLGLVDAGRFRYAAYGAIEVQKPTGRIEPTIGCEMWLRNRGKESCVHAGE